MKLRILAITAALALPSLTPPALAAGTSHWSHNSEADFKAGTLRNAVTTNFGDVKLSRAVQVLLEQDPRISAVTALAESADGVIYAGTSPQGVILQIRDDAITTLTTLEDALSILDLLVDPQGNLLVATGGERGRVVRLDPQGKISGELFTDESVQYIWAIQRADDGTIFAATGPNGRLFEIPPDGDSKVLLDSNENNLLSLLYDGGDLLYVGTDPNGLLYRVHRGTGEAFVLYDAEESEISALARDAAGNLYAGTAQATESMAVEQAALTQPIGRPEAGAGGVPIPSQPPSNPEPPPLPDPNPNEPPPIPSQTPRQLPAIGAEEQAPENDPPGDESPDAPESNGPAETSVQTGQPIRARAGAAGDPGPGGNAIYRITPSGFVSEIFRQPVLVLSLIENDGTLLVGTGSEGVIYQINPAAEETVALAKLDPKQILTLLPAKDGRIFMGLSNTGGIAAMGAGFANAGTFVSPVLDAGQTSQFGTMRLRGSLPKNTALTVATRSGNVQQAGETGWSNWSDETPAAAYLPIRSPAARFLQYRISLSSEDGKATPVIEDVDVAYLVPNLAPRIAAITLEPAETEPQSRGTGIQNITWQVTDPNEDAMEHALYFRTGSGAPWILLKDGIKEQTYPWDTRGVADGRYEVRVVSSDAAANPQGEGRSAARVSEPIFVDNTAPVIGDLKSRIEGDRVTIDLSVVDRAARVASVEYAIDSADDWQAVRASDNIFDSPEEAVTIAVDGLAPGRRQITVRATDEHGNRAIETILVTIDAQANN